MDTEKFIELTEKTLLDNVNLALVFASAMAWNEVIKVFAKNDLVFFLSINVMSLPLFYVSHVISMFVKSA